MSGPAWHPIPGGLARLLVHVRFARVGDTPALWQGRAAAGAAIVGIALARYRGQFHWYKTSRRGPWSDDLPGLHVGIWISELQQATLPGPVSVQLQLSGIAPAWSVMAGPRTPLELHEQVDTLTGTPATILRIAGLDPLDVAILFLARTDVRSLRAGAWHARQTALPGVLALWAEILTGPRSGSRPV
jgi:hypothetical protein